MKQFFLHFFILVCVLLYSLEASSNNSLLEDKQFKSTKDKLIYLLDTCWQSRVSYPQKALEFSFEAIELCKNNPQYSHYEAKANNFIGVIYLNYLFDYKTSIPYYYKALSISEQINDSIQIAYSYNNLGDVYYFIKNNHSALEYGRKSLKIFTELKDSVGILYSLTNVGQALLETEQYDEALNIFKQQIKLANSYNYPSRKAYAQYQIANIYQQVDSFNIAIDYYESALQISEAIGDIKLKSECLNELARLEYKKDDYQAAIELYNRSLEISKGYNYIYSQIINNLGLALVYSKLNDAEKGLSYLKEAKRLTNKIDYPLYIFELFETEISFYKNIDDTENLIKAYREFVNSFEKRLSDYDNNTIEIIQNSIEDQKTMLRYEYDLKESNKDKIYLIIIMSLMIIIIGITVYRNKTILKLNKKLQESNNTKNRLFSIVSHDLRSPFNSAIGFSDLLLLELESQKDSNSYKYAKTLNRTLENTLNLINNLLSWAKANRDKFEIKLERIKLVDIIEEVIEIKSTEIEAKRLNISIDDNFSAEAMVDRGSIFTILINLISNAIKFTPTQGKISVLFKNEKERLIINIKDTGVGMSENQLSKLFDIQNSRSTLGTNDESGTGLGLIITKELIEQNKGTIEIKSKLNEGTTFEISFPKYIN